LKERLLPDIVGLKLATEDTEITEFLRPLLEPFAGGKHPNFGYIRSSFS
jgi:hypothetical protein